MRSIKFRAWDNFNECYYYSNESRFPHLDAFFLHVKFCDEGGNDIVLEQYTGIKDHKQNEVYEGDILKWDSEDGEVTGKVVFKNSDEENLNLSGFVFEILKVEEYEHDNPIEFTIIGNIHENSELLK